MDGNNNSWNSHSDMNVTNPYDREAMKTQLAESLSNNENVVILPGFQYANQQQHQSQKPCIKFFNQSSLSQYSLSSNNNNETIMSLSPGTMSSPNMTQNSRQNQQNRTPVRSMSDNFTNRSNHPFSSNTDTLDTTWPFTKSSRGPKTARAAQDAYRRELDKQIEEQKLLRKQENEKFRRVVMTPVNTLPHGQSSNDNILNCRSQSVILPWLTSPTPVSSDNIQQFQQLNNCLQSQTPPPPIQFQNSSPMVQFSQQPQQQQQQLQQQQYTSNPQGVLVGSSTSYVVSSPINDHHNLPNASPQGSQVYQMHQQPQGNVSYCYSPAVQVAPQYHQQPQQAFATVQQIPIQQYNVQHCQLDDSVASTSTTHNNSTEDESSKVTENCSTPKESPLKIHVSQTSEQLPKEEVKATFYKSQLELQIEEQNRQRQERQQKEKEEEERLARKVAAEQEKMKIEYEAEIQRQKLRVEELKRRQEAVLLSRQQSEESTKHVKKRTSSIMPVPTVVRNPTPTTPPPERNIRCMTTTICKHDEGDSQQEYANESETIDKDDKCTVISSAGDASIQNENQHDNKTLPVYFHVPTSPKIRSKRKKSNNIGRIVTTETKEALEFLAELKAALEAESRRVCSRIESRRKREVVNSS